MRLLSRPPAAVCERLHLAEGAKLFGLLLTFPGLAEKVAVLVADLTARQVQGLPRLLLIGPPTLCRAVLAAFLRRDLCRPLAEHIRTSETTNTLAVALELASDEIAKGAPIETCAQKAQELATQWISQWAARIAAP